MNLCFGQHDACACGIFNRKFGFSIFASYAADGAAQMVSMQRFDVFDFKRLEKEIVKAKECDGCKGVVSSSITANQ